MFSPRFLAALALLAAVAALPADPTDKPKLPKPITTITEDDIDDTPWFSFPLFGNLFAPLWRLLPSFGEIGPKIVTDENKFQVIVNVKDYKKEDLKVTVRGDFIFVKGSHEAKSDDRDVFASQFFHTYTLPVNSSSDDVTAELSSDGYLIVNAPLNSSNNRSKDAEREVPIKETGVPYLKETSSTTMTAITVDKTTTTAQAAVTTEKDREPTTPPNSNREENTEKENDIPNEITP